MRDDWARGYTVILPIFRSYAPGRSMFHSRVQCGVTIATMQLSGLLYRPLYDPSERR
jgi:hypothetical protein